MGSASSYPVAYSHGGGSADGSVTGAGYPIDITGATEGTSIFITIDAGSAVVKLQAHPGPLGEGGTLDERNWVDLSNGGFAVSAGDEGGLAKKVTFLGPFWRSYIVSIEGGGTVETIIPIIRQSVSGSRRAPHNPGQFFHTPYDR